MALLYLSSSERAQVWAPMMAAAGIEMVVGEDNVADITTITHIACWEPPQNLQQYTNLKVVICVGAGVDHIPPLPDGIVLSRTVATGIEEMVRDWVVMAVLMLHRDMPIYLEQADRDIWGPHLPLMTRDRGVGIMGMGRIGKLAAHTLTALGFSVSGYSRSGSPIKNVDMYCSDELDLFLAQTDLLVCLLPLTDETSGLMDENFFLKLPQGASLIHAGRGAHLDMSALKTALDKGYIVSAMLDVTDPEPLPEGHWTWQDPRVIITPHIAASTDSEQGALHVLAVMEAEASGSAIPGVVDPKRGY